MQCSRPEIDQVFARYYSSRLMGMNFCGAGCYGLCLSEGVTRLLLTYPVLLYLARWSALGRGEEATVTPADAELAVTLVDHKHGYSPLLHSRSVRRIVSWLVRYGQVQTLSAWYAR